jgi:hypothetical protein
MVEWTGRKRLQTDSQQANQQLATVDPLNYELKTEMAFKQFHGNKLRYEELETIRLGLHRIMPESGRTGELFLMQDKLFCGDLRDR